MDETRKHTPWGAAAAVTGWPGYFATKDGQIISDSNWRGWGKRLLVPVDNGSGYLKVRLHREGKRHNRPVHVLVAAAWLTARPSPQHEIRHLDGNRVNNTATNLAWGTRKENASDREQHGRTSRGDLHSAAIREGQAAARRRGIHIGRPARAAIRKAEGK